MKLIKQILSSCGNLRVDVMRNSEGAYFLHKFVRKYDSEEDKYYEVRELPNPTGSYGDLESAVKQAESVLKAVTVRDV